MRQSAVLTGQFPTCLSCRIVRAHGSSPAYGMAYLNDNDLLPSLQSGFRASHSTETAMLHVSSCIVTAVDRDKLVALILLDLSAAFDAVDHHILFERMRRSFGITDTAHRWFTSCLTGPYSLCVRRSVTASEMTAMLCGVPQGPVLGSLAFVLYTADLV